jgi:hypothetical protein
MSSWKPARHIIRPKIVNHIQNQEVANNNILNNHRLNNHRLNNNHILHNNNNNINGIYNPRYFDLTEYDLVNKIKESGKKYFNNIKKITCIYKTHFSNGPSGGIGDFIRGSIFLHQISKILDIDFEINLAYHPISKYLINPGDKNISEDIINSVYASRLHNTQPTDNGLTTYINSIDKLFEEIYNRGIFNDCIIMEAIAFPLFKIDNDSKNLIKYHLMFNTDIINNFLSITDKFDIIDNNYNIIHIRTGDKYLVNNSVLTENNTSYLSNIYNIIINNTDFKKKNVLIADNTNIKEYITKQFPSILYVKSKITHIGENVNIVDDMLFDTLVDFVLVCNSRNLLSICPHFHGTGFSYWPSIINNIPYKSFMLES